MSAQTLLQTSFALLIPCCMSEDQTFSCPSVCAGTQHCCLSAGLINHQTVTGLKMRGVKVIQFIQSIKSFKFSLTSMSNWGSLEWKLGGTKQCSSFFLDLSEIHWKFQTKKENLVGKSLNNFVCQFVSLTQKAKQRALEWITSKCRKPLWWLTQAKETSQTLKYNKAQCRQRSLKWWTVETNPTLAPKVKPLQNPSNSFTLKTFFFTHPFKRSQNCINFLQECICTEEWKHILLWLS